MTLRTLIILCGLMAGLWMAAPARAQSCVATSAPALAFATVTNPTAQKDVTGSLNLTCTGTAGQSAKACVYLGPSQDGSISPRHLTNNAASMNFQIYTSTAYGQYVGPNKSEAYETPAFTFSGTGTATVTVPLYGRVFGGQTVAAGQYSTTMTGTIVTDDNPNRSCNSGSGTPRSYQLTATASVDASCQITADDLAFPAASRLDTADIVGTSTIHLTCTSNLPYSVKLNGGMTGNASDRRMGLGGTAPGVIQYMLYKDAGRSQIWGDSTTTQASGTGTGTNQDLTVYGRIPMQATPRAGDYRDTITATVEY